MYNDTITTENKIITKEVLDEIFSQINECYTTLKSQFEAEKQYNEKLDYDYQKWTLKHFSSLFTFNINFYDNTEVKFDNYENFVSVFETRLEEIKHINCHFSINYTKYIKNQIDEVYHQSIYMSVSEKNCEFSFNLSSEDPKLDNIYNLIKERIINAPERYDEIIKNKNIIISKATLALGLLPGAILTILLIFLPVLGDVIKKGYAVYPFMTIFFGYFIGMILNNKIQALYDCIIKDKKYAGYDVDRHRSVYKDDIETFKSKAEVLIGKNSKNLTYREEIKKMSEDYNKYIPIELLIVLVITLVFIVLFNVIGL